MTVFAALLARPVWELVFGATVLGAVCLASALVFFWIGFRIAEFPALAGFEGMFGLDRRFPDGNARVVPTEVAARLKAIQARGVASAQRNSLDELAAATHGRGPGLPLPLSEDAMPKSTRVDRLP